MHSLSLSVRLSTLPGVARVKLTRPDRDNSLTHSAVYFSPLLFPRLSLRPSVIPHSSPIHPAVQPGFTVFSFRLFLPICFLPLLSSPLAGDLFFPVIYLLRCLLIHTRPPFQHQSFHLSFLAISPSKSASQLINLSFFFIHPYVHLTVLLSFPTQPFHPCLRPSPSAPEAN